MSNTEVIAKIKQKNDLTFKLMDAVDIDYDGTEAKSVKDKIDETNSTMSTHIDDTIVHVTSSDKTNWSDKYTKTEVDNAISAVVTNLDWKDAVATYTDIATTYTTPENGWTVNVKDADITYRYNGTEWITISANSIPNATESIDGKMSSADKTKLDGISANAKKVESSSINGNIKIDSAETNVYTHPTTHDPSIITQDANNRFVTDAEISVWNAKANQTDLNTTSNKIGILSELPTTDKTSLVNAIKENTTQMSEIEQKVKTRYFKPKFGINVYWGEASDLLGNFWNATRENITLDLNKYVELGIDEIVIPIHISLNTNTGNFYVVENLTDVAWAITQAELLGLKAICIKVHAQKYTQTDVVNHGWSDFQSQWKARLTDIATAFKNSSVEIMTVHNEVEYIYTNSIYTQFVLDCMNIAKTNGFKTGVTTAGYENNLLVIPDIIANSDVICSNTYVSISNKMEKTTLEDGIIAWEQNGVNQWIQKMREKYPDKDIILSESGVQDYWVSLNSPSKWDWDELLKVATNGKATTIYLQGLLETMNSEDISHVWWWYDLYFYNIKNILNYQLKGVTNNE